MTFVGIALIALYVLGAFLTIITIGKKRDPMTPGLAAVIVFVDLLVVVAILAGWNW